MSEGMIRRLRKKFILTAMLTLVGVMLGISGLIFLTNTLLTRQSIRSILNYLIENDGKIVTEGNRPIEGASDEEPYTIIHFISEITNNRGNVYLSPEFRFTTRYFAVKFDQEGKLLEIQDNHISSISEEEAEQYGRAALKRWKQFGRYKSYYYQVGKKEDGTTIVVFLDSWIQVRANNRLLYSALIMIGFGVFVTFILVWFFSKRAIQSEIQNAELQKQFITDASHELKTPLAVIKANTEMQEMLEGETEWTQSTLRQVDRLSGLIANLVQITKSQEVEKGTRKPTDISHIVNETVKSFSAIAVNEGKEMHLAIDDGVQMKVIDSEVRQLVSLLLDNAIKYCDPDGKVSVTLQKKNRGIQLVVGNTYKEGKNTDYRLFFERFYRKDESHNSEKGGYGIGLSIAENIVKQYNGSLTAKWANDCIYFTAILKEN